MLHMTEEPAKPAATTAPMQSAKPETEIARPGVPDPRTDATPLLTIKAKQNKKPNPLLPKHSNKRSNDKPND
jgi:hypothetical protein